MILHLVNPRGESVMVTSGRWRDILKLARRHGWEPLGTEPNEKHLRGRYRDPEGGYDAVELGDGCVGAIPANPNHTVLVSEPQFLAISAEAASDLTLVVVAENGVRCNDDAHRTLNPQVYDWFPEGPLRVYVGSHNSTVNAYYTLRIEPTEPGSASR